MPVVGRTLIAMWAIALLAFPVRAHAQKSAFIDALTTFQAALPGAYGDEGSQILDALERMAMALQVWNWQNQDAERGLRERAGATAADRALVYADQLRLADAVAAMHDAIAGEPGRASYHVFLGLLEQALDHPAEAGAAFATAHDLAPTDPLAAYLAAAHAGDAGASGAIGPLRLVLAAAAEQGTLRLSSPFPQFALVNDASPTARFAPPLYREGLTDLAAGRFTEALARLSAAAAKDPLVADSASHTPDVRAGIAALRQRRFDEAIRLLRGATTRLPNSAEAHRILGVGYRMSGRFPEAIAQFQAAIRLAPQDERARIALGAALMDAGRLRAAEEVHCQTIAAMPGSIEARRALAQVYDRLDRPTDVIATLDEAASLTLNSNRKKQLYWQIAEYEHLYHRAAARVITLLSRRTWLALNDPDAHKNLGLAYQRAGRDDEAMVEFLMASLLGFEDAEMLSAMGQIHLADGRLDQAEALARRALALNADHAQARYVLGTTLLRLGRADEAAEHLTAFQRLRAAEMEATRRRFESTRATAAASAGN